MDVEALEAFKKKYDLKDEHLEILREQFKEVMGHGNDEQKKQNFREVTEEYTDTGYLKICKLGAGGFGDVYKGINLKTKEIIAIKTIDLEEAKEDIQTIRKEILALTNGKICRQLVGYKGSALYGTELWILMEYVKGGSLYQIIKDKGPLPEEKAAAVIKEVLLCIIFLQSENRLHRDIKGANILIQDSGFVKLADFGAATQLTVTSAQAATFVGSPYWMAPEIMTVGSYDGKADIWSLGITCIEIATGSAPLSNHPAMTAMQMIAMKPPPRLEGPFSEHFKDFVAKCLVKDPNGRASAGQLIKHPWMKAAKGPEILRSPDYVPPKDEGKGNNGKSKGKMQESMQDSSWMGEGEAEESKCCTIL